MFVDNCTSLLHQAMKWGFGEKNLQVSNGFFNTNVA